MENVDFINQLWVENRLVDRLDFEISWLQVVVQLKLLNLWLRYRSVKCWQKLLLIVHVLYLIVSKRLSIELEFAQADLIELITRVVVVFAKLYLEDW